MTAPFRVIAHRGASADAPENTLPAFMLALDQGAQEIELDIRFSSDEEIVVFHDDRLDEKTSRTGRVRHHDAATLLRTDIGTWFDRGHPQSAVKYAGTAIASLEAVFSAVSTRAHYHVELKGFDDWLPLRLLQTIDRHGLRDRVTVTSFSMRPLVKMRALCASVPLCFLLRDAADAVRSAEFRPELDGLDSASVHDYWIDQAASAGFQQVGVRAADVTARTIARAADRGLVVRGWGVAAPEQLDVLLDLGAVGATVDWPALALQIVAGRPADR